MLCGTTVNEHYGLTDPAKRPRHGPFATSRWVPDLGRWQVRLTERGKAEVERVVAAYGGAPLKSIAAAFPPLFRLAARWRDRDAVDQAALLGVVAAVRCWRPGGGAKLETMLTGHVRAQLQKLFAWEYRTLGGFRPDSVEAGRDNGSEGDGGWWSFPDPRAADPAEVRETATSKGVAALLARLSEREQVIIRGRFFAGRTLKDIGEELGITRERVRQIEWKAIEKLRKAARRSPDGQLLLPERITA